uniref:START domain-containing protein n=1 Tax=Zooxanthella nutricula TaxID=1333877 RepID=A0A7S2J190_9DINO
MSIKTSTDPCLLELFDDNPDHGIQDSSESASEVGIDRLVGGLLGFSKPDRFQFLLSQMQQGNPLLTAEDLAKIDGFKRTLSDSPWVPVKDATPGHQAYTYFRDDSPFILTKDVCIVEASMREVSELIDCISTDEVNRVYKMLDPNFLHGEISFRRDSVHCLEYARYRIPLCSPREFVVHSVTALLDELTHVYVCWSVKDPAYPEPSWATPLSSVIRGELLESGILVEELPGGNTCRYTYFMHCDPKGWIPKSIYNRAAADGVDTAKVREIFAKKRKAEGRRRRDA